MINVVIRSIICNKPNIIVLNHVDYLDDSCRNGLISEKVKLFIDKVSAEVSVKVNYAGINEVDLVLLEDK